MAIFKVVIEIDEPNLESAEEHILSLSGSDLVDEIVEVDEEHRTYKNISRSQVMLEDKLEKATQIVQQLWSCLSRGYKYDEAQIHMRAFMEGKRTIKKVVVLDKEEVV